MRDAQKIHGEVIPETSLLAQQYWSEGHIDFVLDMIYKNFI